MRNVSPVYLVVSCLMEAACGIVVHEKESSAFIFFAFFVELSRLVLVKFLLRFFPFDSDCNVPPKSLQQEKKTDSRTQSAIFGKIDHGVPWSQNRHRFAPAFNQPLSLLYSLPLSLSFPRDFIAVLVGGERATENTFIAINNLPLPPIKYYFANCSFVALPLADFS